MFNLTLNENLPNKSVIECVLCIVATSTKTSGPPCSNSHVWFVQWEFISLFIIRVLFLVIGWKKIFLLFRISLSLACRLTFGIFGGTSLILGANFIMHQSPVGAGSSTDWTSKSIGFHMKKQIHSVPKSLGKREKGKHSCEEICLKLLEATISDSIMSHRGVKL